jgi:hypothetical protein
MNFDFCVNVSTADLRLTLSTGSARAALSHATDSQSAIYSDGLHRMWIFQLKKNQNKLFFTSIFNDKRVCRTMEEIWCVFV